MFREGVNNRECALLARRPAYFLIVYFIGTVGTWGLYMSSQIASNQDLIVKSGLSSLTQTLSALVFGAVIIFAVGFVPVDAAHNAAHDTRHSLAFPCH